MKKYKVYDLYEDKEAIGYADTIFEINRMSRNRYLDTDGECDIWYAEINPETLKYKFSELKHYETIIDE